MGLDMYLEKMPRYKNTSLYDVWTIGNYIEWENEKENPKSKYRNCTFKEWCGVDESEIPDNDTIEFYRTHARNGNYGLLIAEEVAYWRKANAIHGWFVNNVQRGNDDCGAYEVTSEDLIELRNVCDIVLCNLDAAERLLPHYEGSFFGSYDYGEAYINQLEYTIDVIDEILSSTNFETEMISYVSDW